jgi:feruloyl-CoA synthase
MIATSAPFRDVRLGSTEVIVERAASGVIYVRSAQPLGPYPGRMTDRLDHWAVHAPDRTFIAKRGPDGNWLRISYREMRTLARNAGEALVGRGLSSERPMAIISGNDLEHVALALGAMYAGIPFAPISPSYSLLSKDFAKLRHIINLLTPGLIFAANGAEFARAIHSVAPADAEIVNTTNVLPGATLYSDLVNTTAGAALDAAHARVNPDTVLKILFTSGSTGTPKGVMNTHRMWSSNQEMVRACWPFVAEEPPVILDWLPWNHTFAGNKDFGLILYNGGTLYLDDGKPVPGAFEESIRNLREIAPTIYLNVPRGYEALVPYLRREPELRKHFFSRLRIMFYAAAGLSQQIWDDLAELSIQTCGERILMLTGLGSTETAPFALWVSKEVSRAGVVGIPAPGVELKLAPVGHKLEARVKGPSITPGYWRQEDLTRAAFDEEGFYKFGDALLFVDENDAAKGFIFDGRMTEDFKLSSGTWVSVGPLRGAFLNHAVPYAREVVIAGHDRDFVAVLAFPDVDACRGLCPGLDATASASEVLASAPVRSRFRALLEELSRQSTGSSNRIARLILLDRPPSIDSHELTDKGSINQKAVLANRSAQVEELYTNSPRVITL